MTKRACVWWSIIAAVALTLSNVGCGHPMQSGVNPADGGQRDIEAAGVSRIFVNGAWSGTAWHLGDGRWITAGHICDAGAMFNIGANYAVLIKRAPKDDLCVLQAHFTTVNLTLGVAPEFGARVHFIGFPESHFGIWDGLYVGADQVSSDGDVMFTGFVNGGASGSPLLDENGYVVGVVVSSYRERPYSYAEPVLDLRVFLETM